MDLLCIAYVPLALLEHFANLTVEIFQNLTSNCFGGYYAVDGGHRIK